MKRWIIIFLVIVAGVALFTQRVVIKDYFTSVLKEPVPPALPYADVVGVTQQPSLLPPPVVPSVPATNEAAPQPPVVPVQPVPVPAEINLAVPFEPQAPFGDWSMPYKEACEEASLIMVDHYLRGMPLSPEEMKAEIDAQAAWQKLNGYAVDVSAPELIKVADYFYDYTTELVEGLTYEKIKDQLRRGRPVIVPAAGRELGNPYYRQPGPLYHMLVIKGYTKDGRLITNDPGTRRGADYIYDAQVLLNAIRDWDGDSPDGPKVGIVMYK